MSFSVIFCVVRNLIKCEIYCDLKSFIKRAFQLTKNAKIIKGKDLF